MPKEVSEDQENVLKARIINHTYAFLQLSSSMFYRCINNTEPLFF